MIPMIVRLDFLHTPAHLRSTPYQELLYNPLLLFSRSAITMIIQLRCAYILQRNVIEFQVWQQMMFLFGPPFVW